MTQEEILEGNKLIAEYVCVDESIPHDHQGYYLYHQSMDWLLPTINKIKESEQFCIISTDYDKWEVSIETTGYHYATQAFQINDSLVEGCWLACIEYIEKFNTGTLKQSKK